MSDEHGTGLIPEDDDIPPSNIDPLNGALLALHAMREGGMNGEITVISHNDYWKLTSEEQQQKVHLVLQEATYKLWQERYPNG